MKTDPGTNWLSIYIYQQQSVYGLGFRKFLGEFLYDFIIINNFGAPYYSNWFFMRYGEGGPHLRLRFECKERVYAKSLYPLFKEKLEKYISRLQPIPRVGFFKSKLLRVDSSLLKAHGFCDLHHYDRELMRYGGLLAIKAVESHFNDSSEIILRLIKSNINASIDSQILISAQITITYLQAFDISLSRAIGLCLSCCQAYIDAEVGYSSRGGIERNDYLMREFMEKSYHNAEIPIPVKSVYRKLKNHLHQSNNLLDQISNHWNKSAHEEYLVQLSRSAKKLYSTLTMLSTEDNLHTGVSENISHQTKIEAILASIIHMSNNRFGLNLLEESWINFAISQALSPAS